MLHWTLERRTSRAGAIPEALGFVTNAWASCSNHLSSVGLKVLQKPRGHVFYRLQQVDFTKQQQSTNRQQCTADIHHTALPNNVLCPDLGTISDRLPLPARKPTRRLLGGGDFVEDAPDCHKRRLKASPGENAILEVHRVPEARHITYRWCVFKY